MVLCFRDTVMGKPQIRNAILERMAVEIYSELGSGNAVAKRLGVAPSTAYRMLLDAGIDVPDRADPKPRRRKLNEDQAKGMVALYEAGESLAVIKDRFGIADHSIREYVKRAGKKLRTVGGKKREFSDGDIDEIVRLFQGGLSRQQIAVNLSINQSSVTKLLSSRGFKSDKHARGSKHGSWNGGITVTSDGYVKQKILPDDPLRGMAGRNGYVPQHRLVMARAMGRPLDPHETVHHINGDRGDNNLSNLQLRSGKHGKGMRFVCACCGSNNVIAKEIE